MIDLDLMQARTPAGSAFSKGAIDAGCHDVFNDRSGCGLTNEGLTNEGMINDGRTKSRSVCGQPRLIALALAIGLGAAGIPFALSAQDVGAVPAGPTTNATVNLIRLLVEKGVLSESDAKGLISQAQAEAEQVQARTAVAAVPAAPGAQPAVPGEQRIQYVPQVVQDQITAQARQAVLAEVKEQGWARPEALPNWIDRIAFDGDVRLRNQTQSYGDANTPILLDYNAINNEGPYDVNEATNPVSPPHLNTRRSRNLNRVRARLGVSATLADDWEAGLRLASGSDNSPVSTNQTMGGGLSKKEFWLDRAYLTWRPASWLTVSGGRFRNPFISTQALFDTDLNFDGVAAQFDLPLQSATESRMFGTLGAFPLQTTSDDFPSSSQNKAGNNDKWLYSGQVGMDWELDNDNRLRASLAWHKFNNYEGRLSQPCELFTGINQCSTDWSRPEFMQKGNTLMLLRQIVLNDADGGLTPQPQYVGLASKFSLADLNLRFDTRFGDLPFSVEGNLIRNLSYDAATIMERSLNGSVLVTNQPGVADDPANPIRLDSGDTAWQVQTLFGKAELAKAGEWNAMVGYRYIEPDALPDGFNDSNFHLGGTNAKGYYLSGSWGLAPNVWLQGRWLSSKQISGAPLEIDVLQLDVNARF